MSVGAIYADLNTGSAALKHEIERLADSCGVPMAVWREHTEAILECEKAAMLSELARVADIELGKGRWWLDSIRRMSPEHPHWHARGSW